ncbi:MAG: polymerase sigma-54 factor [Candidatus Cloacimonadota bacterium]|jgi:RNA polymerase sigma-54 factor|nr:polymerase sigma-54 factor [Candidatus Cloacimonadota bacterium]
MMNSYKQNYSQKLSQKLSQNLLLKPKMLQSLEMLAMPIMQLETYLKHELVNNPMLELQEDKPEEAEQQEEETEGENQEDKQLEKTLAEAEELSEILDFWNENNETHSSSKGRSDDDSNFEQRAPKQNRKGEFIDQLEGLQLSDNEYDFAYDLIESINERGFLPDDFDMPKMAHFFHLPLTRAEEIHQEILHLYPRGITARDLIECLTVQIDDSEDKEYLQQIIKEDFTDLIHKRYKKIASKYGVSLDTVLAWKEKISKLDPKPGLRLEDCETDYIVPDVIIKKIDGEFEIISNDYYLPKIRMSKHYKNILNQVKDDRTALDYVRGKVNSAKFMIKSIYLRQRTLERVVRSIINHQKDFFYNNSSYLAPLTYSVIAQELQVNESTISRVVKDKYADTPFGIMCLKDFFTSKAGKDSGYNSVSRQNVEIQLKRMIEKEDKSNPLSDQEIVDIFKKSGINVSRRVVSKYREAMGILNSHLRKEK